MNRTAILFVVVTASCANVVEQEEREHAGETASEGALSPVAFGGNAIDISFWQGPLSEAETECFWASGVRHVVVGTQLEELTQQQLAMAVSRGMTVDAYVYLTWDKDMAAQIDDAFAFTSGFPIGRMWLDIEEEHGASGGVVDKIGAALDECNARAGATVECGIYTGSGFWRTYAANTTSYDDVPLWWAWYDGKTALSSWSGEQFGGWTEPVAKQFSEQGFCNYGADRNTMIVTASPTVEVDHDPAPVVDTAPPAPDRLWPADGSVTHLDETKLMCGVVAGATHYQFALDRWNGSQWLPYFTWTTVNAFQSVYPSPSLLGFVYRFRVRAENAHGWGAWSAYSTFDWGDVKTARPPSSPPPSPPTSPPPPTSSQPPSSQPPSSSPSAPPSSPPPPPSSPPPPSPAPTPDGAPANLAPDASTGPIATDSVTLTCDAIANATSYAFSIETRDANGALHPYITYTRSAPSTTFWPQAKNTTYVWRVRANVGGTWGAWSNDASFDYE